MINDDEKNQLLNTIEILTREHRAMSQTLTSAQAKATEYLMRARAAEDKLQRYLDLLNDAARKGAALAASRY